MIRINDDLFLVRKIMSEEYEVLGSEWNEISPLYKTFKQNGRIFFCELIENVETIDDIVENPTT